MASQNPNGVHIDRIHNAAICTEIGERLRATLTGNPARLPPHLLGLTRLFDGVESGDVAFKNPIEIDSR